MGRRTSSRCGWSSSGARIVGFGGAVLTVVFGLISLQPAIAAEGSGSASASPSPSPSATQSPSSEPAPAPTPGPSAGRPPSPKPRPRPTTRPPTADEGEPAEGKRRKKTREEDEKERPPVVDMAVVQAAAEKQLATAKADLARAERAVDQARARLRAAEQHVAALRHAGLTVEPPTPTEARAQAAVKGLKLALIGPISVGSDVPSSGDEVGLLASRPLAEAAGLGGSANESDAANETGSAGAVPEADPGAARPGGEADGPPSVSGSRANGVLASAEAARRDAQAALDQAEAALSLVRLNIRTAKASLGLADGSTSAAAAAKQFADYPVGECSFPGVQTPNDCREAQRWAIAQTINPMKDWYYLCLGFVTNAYGYSSGAPTAIAHWEALPESRKHSPNTVAPPGALMFWAPNHVAISLGNNVMVSTDVLGNGRVWIVDFATIQEVWSFQYLGWAEPDFMQ